LGNINTKPGTIARASLLVQVIALFKGKYNARLYFAGNFAQLTSKNVYLIEDVEENFLVQMI
jgi:hypothetical protein